MSVNPRLNRLFTPNGKCLQVALDHGLANEASTLPGMENMQQVVGAVAAANPDAMILTTGASPLASGSGAETQAGIGGAGGCHELLYRSDAEASLLQID